MPRLTTTITICDVDCPSMDQTNPFTIDFTATDYGEGTTYEWDFGDSETDETSTNTTSHTYAAEGTYEVSVTFTTESGEQGIVEGCSTNVLGCMQAPAAFWSFNADDGRDDANSNHLTNNGVAFASGEAFFDGSADLSIPDNAALSMGTGQVFTLVMWLFIGGGLYLPDGPGLYAGNGVTPLNKGQLIFGGGDFEYCLQFYQDAAFDQMYLLFMTPESNAHTLTNVAAAPQIETGPGAAHLIVAWYDGTEIHISTVVFCPFWCQCDTLRPYPILWVKGQMAHATSHRSARSHCNRPRGHFSRSL